MPPENGHFDSFDISVSCSRLQLTNLVQYKSRAPIRTNGPISATISTAIGIASKSQKHQPCAVSFGAFMSHRSNPMLYRMLIILLITFPLAALAQGKETRMEQPVFYRNVKIDG